MPYFNFALDSGLNICMPLHIIFDTPLAGPFKGCQGNVEVSAMCQSPILHLKEKEHVTIVSGD